MIGSLVAELNEAVFQSGTLRANIFPPGETLRFTNGKWKIVVLYWGFQTENKLEIIRIKKSGIT